ncbi:ArsC/Spx/MgsR family protein, partial [Helcococcus bovis]
TIYKENKIKDKLNDMTLDEKYDILSTNGMLVKRPILLEDDKILVGPEVKKYIEELE